MAPTEQSGLANACAAILALKKFDPFAHLHIVSLSAQVEGEVVEFLGGDVAVFAIGEVQWVLHLLDAIRVALISFH